MPHLVPENREAPEGWFFILLVQKLKFLRFRAFSGPISYIFSPKPTLQYLPTFHRPLPLFLLPLLHFLHRRANRIDVFPELCSHDTGARPAWQQPYTAVTRGEH